MSEGYRSGSENEVRRLFGAFLMAAGVLIMLLCGLCTAAGLLFGLALASETPGLANELTAVISIVLVGGLPFVFGLALFLWGRNLRKLARIRPKPIKTDPSTFD